MEWKRRNSTARAVQHLDNLEHAYDELTYNPQHFHLRKKAAVALDLMTKSLCLHHECEEGLYWDFSHHFSESNISEAAINCNTRQADEQALQQQNI